MGVVDTNACCRDRAGKALRVNIFEGMMDQVATQASSWGCDLAMANTNLCSMLIFYSMNKPEQYKPAIMETIQSSTLLHD